MKTADVVLSTSSETDRTFNTGALGVVLLTLAGLASLYYLSVLTLTEAVLWALVGVPAVAFTAAIVLAGWLGYSDEAHTRSLRYAARLNYDTDE